MKKLLFFICLLPSCSWASVLVNPSRATTSFPYGLTASSLTITNNTSTMTATFTTLPINGGFGPQVSDPRWLMISNVDGTTAATFTLRSSTYNNTDYHHIYSPEMQMTPSTTLGGGSISWALGPAGETPISVSSQGFTVQSASLTVNGPLSASSVASDLIPNSDTIYNLGSSGNRFLNGYFNHLYISDENFGGLTPALTLYSATILDSNYVEFSYSNGGDHVTYANLVGDVIDAADGFESGRFFIKVKNLGVLEKAISIYGTDIIGSGGGDPTVGTINAAYRVSAPGFTLSGSTTGAVSATNGVFSVGTLSTSNGGTGATSYTNGQLLFGNTASGGLIVSTMSGTTNQVTVTASSFNVTLSLPQSINTGATPQFIGLGMATPGSSAQLIKFSNGTTTRAPINFNNGGVLKTTPASGDFDANVDDVYIVIQTGAARKNFVLADSALATGGHVPYTTTNGRLVDTSFFTFDGSRLAINGGSSGGSVSLMAGGKPAVIANGDIWYNNSTRFQVAQQSSTQTLSTMESTQTFTAMQSFSSMNVTLSGRLFSGGALVGLIVSTYSDSGSYNFGTTTNTIAIANSSSTITLTSSGTYRIDGMANMRYNGATFAANQFVTLNLYRQNNTPGVIANSQSQEETQISVSGLTSQFGQFNLPPIFYTTTLTNDVISLQGSISATPGAGNFQATEASLVAQRLY